MDIFLRQWWYDPRFKSNYSKPFNMAVDPTTMIWTPDTYFWNVKDAKYHHVTRENMRVQIWPNGKIYYSTRWDSNSISVLFFTSDFILGLIFLAAASESFTVANLRY